MSESLLLADYLSDCTDQKRSSVSAVLDSFVSYIEHLYDDSSYPFSEYLEDNDDDLAIAFGEMIRANLSIGFSVDVSLVGRHRVSDSIFVSVEIKV